MRRGEIALTPAASGPDRGSAGPRGSRSRLSCSAAISSADRCGAGDADGGSRSTGAGGSDSTAGPDARFLFLRRRPRRRSPAANGSRASKDGARHVLHALLLEQLLHALDRVALVVQEAPDELQPLDVFGPVIAPSPRPLQRPDLRKPRLPEAQHVLRQIHRLRRLHGSFERPRGSCPSQLARACPAGRIIVPRPDARASISRSRARKRARAAGPARYSSPSTPDWIRAAR